MEKMDSLSDNQVNSYAKEMVSDLEHLELLTYLSDAMQVENLLDVIAQDCKARSEFVKNPTQCPDHVKAMIEKPEFILSQIEPLSGRLGKLVASVRYLMDRNTILSQALIRNGQELNKCKSELKAVKLEFQINNY